MSRKSATRGRTAPPETIDRKTVATGESRESTSSNRRPWKKKSVVDHIFGLVDKLREDVAEKERAYLEAKEQLDKLEQLRDGLKSQ